MCLIKKSRIPRIALKDKVVYNVIYRNPDDSYETLVQRTQKQNNMKTITIQIPDNCEVKIVKKEEKKEPTIRTYQDLIDNNFKVKGYIINHHCKAIPFTDRFHKNSSEEIAASEKVVKSMLAMAMISQLMPYYGGAITDEEWKDTDHFKFIIKRTGDKIEVDYYTSVYRFLAFHTEKQRDEFLKHNEQLVKDYLMID